MKREALSFMCFTTLGGPYLRFFFTPPPYVANSGVKWSNEALATLALGYCFRAVCCNLWRKDTLSVRRYQQNRAASSRQWRSSTEPGTLFFCNAQAFGGDNAGEGV